MTDRRDGPDALRLAQAACQELYHRYARRLLAFLAAQAPSAVLEDLHHAVWVKVWEKTPEHFDGRHFRGWLFAIARHCLIDYQRKPVTPASAELEQQVDPRPADAAEQLLDEERRRILERCLQGLAPRLSALMRGRLAGEDYAELCETLGLSAAQAHKLFHTAKAQLQECVKRTWT
ncbi:MAG: RNA polymerase sigma factor [Gemmataceae bacterium]